MVKEGAKLKIKAREIGIVSISKWRCTEYLQEHV